MKPAIISHLNDYFQNNDEPILKEQKKTDNKLEENDETIKKIIDVLDTKIRLAVARDGGDIVNLLIMELLKLNCKEVVLVVLFINDFETRCSKSS